MHSELRTLVQRINGFSNWNHADKIRFFAWFLHAQGQQRIAPSDIGKCYESLHAEPPSNISPFLTSMEKRSPKEVLRDSRGYYLEQRVREDYDQRYGQREITVQVTKLLADLPEKVPDLAEKDFLKESIICYRNGAFRAAIVMCWSLTFFHLCQFVLKRHLHSFNTTYPTRYPDKHKKAKVPIIGRYEDFAVDLKESEVLEICKSASMISNDIFKILDDKLGRRNSAAHPSSVHFGQLQAEEFIHDLVTNVVLALKV
jgi:hypothetical protein